MGRLDVRVVGARNLANDQLVGKPDPYVILKLEHQTHRSSTAEDSTDPTWNEIFKFTVADENSAQLKLEVWNKNLVSDEFMGEYSIGLAGLTKQVVDDKWYILKQSKTNAEIRVRLLALDFGAEPPADAALMPQMVAGSPIAPLAPPPAAQPMPLPPPAQGYPVPPPPQSYVAPPPPQRFAQPQWGTTEKCEVKDKKSGLGGLVSALGSAVTSTISAVAGTASSVAGSGEASTLFIDDRTGYMYLQIDGGLRLIPTPEVFQALFNRPPTAATFQHFTGPHPTWRFLAPLPSNAILFRAGPDGAIYLLDSLPPACVHPCRRLILESAWKQFRFGTGANLVPMDASQALSIVDGDPIHGPMA